MRRTDAIGLLDNYSDAEVAAIMQQLVAEAILEGRLDADDNEKEQAAQIGLSLGFVHQDSDGDLALGPRAAGIDDYIGMGQEILAHRNKKTGFGAGKKQLGASIRKGVGSFVKRNSRSLAVAGTAGLVGAGVGLFAGRRRKTKK